MEIIIFVLVTKIWKITHSIVILNYELTYLFLLSLYSHTAASAMAPKCKSTSTPAGVKLDKKKNQTVDDGVQKPNLGKIVRKDLST